MLSAFLAFKNTCAPGDFDYLFSFYILEHKSSPVVSVQAGTMKNAQTFAVTKVDTPGLCSRPCVALGAAANGVDIFSGGITRCGKRVLEDSTTRSLGVWGG